MLSPGTWIWVAVVVLVVSAGCLFVIWRKGQPFARGDVFRASRWSRHNRLFPTQVLITASSVVQFTPRWFGRREESIHIAHVSSVRIETGMLWSDVFIETSGGADPIRCHGHSKADAGRMKALVDRYQSEFYRSGGRPPA